jgi:SAM-dependent methyltransferase
VTVPANEETLKQAVQAYWEAEPCGTRGFDPKDRKSYFRAIEEERYRVEPYIHDFARFKEARGKRVLEVGVGAGTDFVNWVRAGADATGVDLTHRGVELTRERLALEGLTAKVQQADAEALPFPDGTFDLVYSYGVLHHSANPEKAVHEVHRVLKPGGRARVMIYHHPSLTGFMLWGLHCAAKLRPWKSPRWAVSEYLESPGTHVYSVPEARALFSPFEALDIRTQLGTGDLLLMSPSAKYRSVLHQAIWRLYPRGLVERFGRGLGLVLMVNALKAGKD